MDDIAYLVSVQPVLVSLILSFVCIWLGLNILDFLLSVFVSSWRSPNGFRSRKRGVHSNNETK